MSADGWKKETAAAREEPGHPNVSARCPEADCAQTGKRAARAEAGEVRKLLYARLSLLTTGVLLAAVLLVGGLRGATVKRMAETNPARDASKEKMAVQGAAIVTFATDRDELRAEELRQLSQIAADETASQEIREEANRRRMQVMAWIEQEAAIAQVLAARGFVCPVVTVHADSANVLVRAESLSRQEAGIILELVTRETGIAGGNVKIVPIN